MKVQGHFVLIKPVQPLLSTESLELALVSILVEKTSGTIL